MLTIIFLALTTLGHAYAGDEIRKPQPRYEATASTGASISLADKYLEINGKIGFGYYLQKGIQLAYLGSYSYSKVNRAQDSRNYQLVGAIFNRSLSGKEDYVNDAFFFGILGGVAFIDTSSSRPKTYATFQAVVGKRFLITDSVSYKPQVILQVVGEDPIFSAVPLSFSFFF